jgi:hypothetical protein
MARFMTVPCAECCQPIHWWNRRVWLVDGDRCAHRHCWKGQLFLKAYVDLMAEEIRQTAAPRLESHKDESTESQLQELRAFARALRHRVERLEAQLQQAEELAAKMRTADVADNGRSNAEVSGSHGLDEGVKRNE